MEESYKIYKAYHALSVEEKAACIFVEAREAVEERGLDSREVEQTMKEVLKLINQSTSDNQ